MREGALVALSDGRFPSHPPADRDLPLQRVLFADLPPLPPPTDALSTEGEEPRASVDVDAVDLNQDAYQGDGLT